MALTICSEEQKCSIFCSFRRRKSSAEIIIEPEILMTRDVQRTESWDRVEREKDIRQAIDLATTLERIEKNFVITDPRLPDNPIVRNDFNKEILEA